MFIGFALNLIRKATEFAAPAPPSSTSKLLMQDGTSGLLLQDGTSFLLLQG